MSAYFQMGHDTENLIGETDLKEFEGIILSPVNRTPEELTQNIPAFREKGNFDIVLDCQLYFPRSSREKLNQHPYFPSDLDTADISSNSWWNNMINRLSDYAAKLGVDGVTSPVIFPRIWNDDYYARCADVCSNLYEKLSKIKINTLATLMVDLKKLADEDYTFRLASIMSNASCAGFYLVFYIDTEPRRELAFSEELFGAMMVIKELKNTGLSVIISFCSSDMILFKAAGADHCASGKFFNLRRFTTSRWEEPSQGGGVLPYWFEHSLLAFIREADILRLLREGHADLIERTHSRNYWSNRILTQFKKEPGKAWVGLSWRHYLSWFGKTEMEITNGNPIQIVKDWLKIAEKNWLMLEDEEILFEEPRNNGSWMRPWRQAIAKFSKYYNL